MTQARASHLKLVVNETAPASTREPRLRFRPVVRLDDGVSFGLDVETDITFEETFSLRDMMSENAPSAATWLGDIIERTAKLAQETGNEARPISIVAPMSALADLDAPMAAEAGARRANVLPQEIRIDFTDASVSEMEEMALDRIENFRKHGFRVGLDARKSWRTPMNARARITFESVRIEPTSIAALDIPISRMEVAAADGVSLIAENVMWRDAEKLAEVGICYAVAPRADS